MENNAIAACASIEEHWDDGAIDVDAGTSTLEGNHQPDCCDSDDELSGRLGWCARGGFGAGSYSLWVIVSSGSCNVRLRLPRFAPIGQTSACRQRLLHFAISTMNAPSQVCSFLHIHCLRYLRHVFRFLRNGVLYLFNLIWRRLTHANMASAISSRVVSETNGMPKRRILHLKTKEECRLGNDTIQVWTVELPSKHAEGVLKWVDPISRQCTSTNNMSPELSRIMWKDKMLLTFSISVASPNQSICLSMCSVSEISRKRCTQSRGLGSARRWQLCKLPPQLSGNIQCPPGRG